MAKMTTSSNLDAIIAPMNSIQRRTQERVMSAVAPAKAKGANTAAMRIVIFRISIAAQTTTTEHNTTVARSMVTTGLVMLLS
jgi:hypothetical protein